MKPKPSFHLTLIVLIITILLSTNTCREEEIPATMVEKANVIPSELEDVMVNLLAKESPSGGVIAHLTDLSGEPREAIGIWAIQLGEPLKGDVEDLQRAFSDDRSQWPPKTFLFAVELFKEYEAVITVKTYYDMGITPKSRGGNERVWTFRKDIKGWKVVKTETIVLWD